MSGWIGVDLDGTLALYNGWGDGKIGAPIPAMAQRVRDWLASDTEVRIVTARVADTGLPNQIGTVDDTAFADAQRQQIQDWTELHFGKRLVVTATKDFGMVELWDDRAVQVEPNTGRRIGESSAVPEVNAPGWQPIETVPQDSKVLLWGKHGAAIGYWGEYLIHNVPKFTHWRSLDGPKTT